MTTKIAVRPGTLPVAGLKERLAQANQLRLAPNKAHDMWRQCQLPEKLIITAADFVEFAIDSGLAYSLAWLDAAAHIQIDGQGVPSIKVEGVWTSWNTLKKQIFYDREKKQLTSKNNQHCFYIYTSQRGLVPVDRGSYSLFPVHKLTPTEHQAIREAGLGFWKTHPEVDEGISKECVLQFVQTTREPFARNWLTENCLDAGSQHTGIRLVDIEGNLYSFGLKVSSELIEYVQAHPLSFLASGYGQVAFPDYEETRVYYYQRVTTVPITKERFESIVAFVNQVIEAKGIRFCQTKPNCNTFGVAIGRLAGLEIDTEMTLPEVLVAGLPSIGQLPLIGRVVQAAQSVFAMISSYTPRFVTYVPRKIVALTCNIILSVFGAMREGEPVRRPEKIGEFVRFSRLINSVYDLFDEEKIKMNHSYKMVAWQRKHGSATKEFFYEGRPKLHL